MGYWVSAVPDSSPAARSGLKIGDDAYDKNDQVFISFIRWFPQTAEFKTLVSPRRFVE